MSASSSALMVRSPYTTSALVIKGDEQKGGGLYQGGGTGAWFSLVEDTREMPESG